MTQENITAGVRAILGSMRQYKRRTVVQPAVLSVGALDIDCTAYDVSLGGIRLKVDVPIAQGAAVYVYIQDRIKQAAQVIWTVDGFMGLKFQENPDRVRKNLGSLVKGLN